MDALPIGSQHGALLGLYGLHAQCAHVPIQTRKQNAGAERAVLPSSLPSTSASPITTQTQK